MAKKPKENPARAHSLTLNQLRWKGKTKAQRTAQGKLMAAARWSKKDA